MPRKLPRLETPIQAAKREEQERKATFSERYEEELKKQLFEETNLELKEEVQEVLEAKHSYHKKRPGEEWDVPITEEIKYFDPELSYEITGYRPLTMEQGLDFDPEPFKEMANLFEQTGKYTTYPEKSKPWRELWTREFERCNEGLTIGKYRLTGDHYYFLNYYRMMTINENSKSAGSGRQESFPGFLSKQYEFFHYVEMAEKLRKDVCILKARGIGLSEIVAALSVRPYTTKRGYNVMITAPDAIKLSGLKQKCWLQLDWLNMNTQGGMRHVRQKVNNDDTKRASKVLPDNTETGWMSQITSVIADNPNKIRGPRLDRLIYEEAGSSTSLTDSWIKGDALVSLGGDHFGTRIALGTGGDFFSLEGLSTMFLNPEAYNILPFKNYDTDDGKPELTSFFIPAHKFALTSKYLDNRGVTNHEEFKKYYIEQRNKLNDKDLISEQAEHPFVPREALSVHGENVFDPVVIAERIVQIKTNQDYTKPTKMQLLWDPSVGNGMQKVIARESSSSNLLIVEPPMVDESGNVFKNLYVAGIDSIDIGDEDSTSSSNRSDYCIVVKKRIFGLDDPKYVAIYKCRPKDIRQAYDLTIKLLTWYNCKAMLEATRMGIKPYFEQKGKGNLLMSRPQFAMSTVKKPSNKQLIGIQASPAIIKHGLELVNSFVNDYWYTIDFEEMLDQLLNYSYENKGKFDIIAALLCCEIGDEDMYGIKPSNVQNIKNQWKDIGWYTDERGYKKYGVIPRGYYETSRKWY